MVDDQALAQRITRFKGELKAISGAELTIAEATLAELDGMTRADADAIIYPSDQLGSLAEQRIIRAIPTEWLQKSAFHEDEIFEPAGLSELKWGDSVVAAPLGSPVFICFYRRDLLQQLHREPPKTWAEYGELAKLLADREKLSGAKLPEDWTGAVEPLSSGWAGKLLLARAAAYAKHRDYFATLWDHDTMAPRIASPPFVRALEELVAVTGGNSAALTITPANARRAFLTGHCGMAISWPTAADPSDAGASADGPAAADIGLSALPGATEAYNKHESQWQKRPAEESSQVPLLSISGRVGSVTTTSKSPRIAFEVLSQISGDSLGGQISPASAATAPYRLLQLAEAGRWMERPLAAAGGKEYATVIETALTSSQFLTTPRIPGQSEYLAALDDAARSAVRGEKKPAAALEEAAAEWDKITDHLGRDKQAAAYRASLGL